MAKARILIVEDEGIVALDIRNTLVKLGYAVCAQATSGEAAIQKAGQTSPDLVLMDIRLRGEMDGLQAAEQIRSRFDIPVVYLTAHADEATVQRAKITQPFGYLLKPFEEGELHTAIEIALYRHQMDKRLRESEERLSTTLRSIGDAVIATDVRGQITFMNPVAETLTGWKQTDALGKDSQEVFHIIDSETRAPAESPVAQALREGVTVGLARHTLLITRDGTQTLVDDSAAPIRDDQGRITGVVLAFRDVTQRVQAEQEIRRRNRELSVLNQVIAASAAGLATEHVLETACRELAQAFDVPQASVALLNEEKTSAVVAAEYRAEGWPPMGLGGWPPAPQETLPVKGDPAWEGLLRHPTPLKLDGDGSVSLVLPILIQADVVGSLTLRARQSRHFSAEEVGLAESVASQLAGSLARARSEEERRKLEEERYQVQKMEALGRLTGGVAHEFNNLLTVMNGFAEIMQHQIPPDSPLQRLATAIRHSGRRAAGLVGQLLAFSRTQIMEPRVLDLNQVVADMHAMLSRIVGEHIVMETVLAPDLWAVRVDPAQIELVIINLVVNARDAMPHGGRLTLLTANVVLAEGAVLAGGAVLAKSSRSPRRGQGAQSPQGKEGAVLAQSSQGAKSSQGKGGDVAEPMQAQPGEYVLLTVSDTGIGMSQEVRSHIFEPFFTTKPAGEGTGLGLATVHGIVKQSGGDITCDSQEGVGTTFKVYLPRVKAAVQPSANNQPRLGKAMPVGAETLLVVEDDRDVRDLARQVLQRQGYTLLEAGDGQEALRIAAGYPGPIHLLLADLVMPGMNGKVLAGQLSQTRPDLKTLFISGYTGDIISNHGLLNPDVAFLPKPFGAWDLARMVRNVLDS